MKLLNRLAGMSGENFEEKCWIVSANAVYAQSDGPLHPLRFINVPNPRLQPGGTNAFNPLARGQIMAKMGFVA